MPGGFTRCIPVTSASDSFQFASIGADGPQSGNGITYSLSINGAARRRCRLRKATSHLAGPDQRLNDRGTYQDGGTQTAFIVKINADGSLTVTQNVPLEHLSTARRRPHMTISPDPCRIDHRDGDRDRLRRRQRPGRRADRRLDHLRGRRAEGRRRGQGRRRRRGRHQYAAFTRQFAFRRPGRRFRQRVVTPSAWLLRSRARLARRSILAPMARREWRLRLRADARQRIWWRSA